VRGPGVHRNRHEPVPYHPNRIHVLDPWPASCHSHGVSEGLTVSAARVTVSECGPSQPPRTLVARVRCGAQLIPKMARMSSSRTCRSLWSEGMGIERQPLRPESPANGGRFDGKESGQFRERHVAVERERRGPSRISHRSSCNEPWSKDFWR
jgi:hypothetical protein